MKLLKVIKVAQQYTLGKEDLISVKKVSAVGSSGVARLVFSHTRVPDAQYSKPCENQPRDHLADIKSMTEPECPLTPPQDSGSDSGKVYLLLTELSQPSQVMQGKN